jgi:hypothetical protein
MKIGRGKWLIKKLVFERSNNQKNAQLNTSLDNSKSCINKDALRLSCIFHIETINRKAICRFCFTNDHSKENPLLSPCKCKGTMKYAHYNCLMLWIKSKADIKILGHNEAVQLIYIRSLKCELCQSTIPGLFLIKM